MHIITTTLHKHTNPNAAQKEPNNETATRHGHLIRSQTTHPNDEKQQRTQIWHLLGWFCETTCGMYLTVFPFVLVFITHACSAAATDHHYFLQIEYPGPHLKEPLRCVVE